MAEIKHASMKRSCLKLALDRRLGRFDLPLKSGLLSTSRETNKQPHLWPNSVQKRKVSGRPCVVEVFRYSEFA